MKKFIGLIAAFLAVILFANLDVSAREQEFRGVWVTTVINLDWPSRPGLSAAEMMAEADIFLDRAAEIGFNAVLLQVRPAGDAIYRSEIFPWSKYLTGTQGQAPPDGFDPLAYWIQGAHSRGMELHAWINPYRVTHGTSRITNVNYLSPNNPARISPYMVRVHGSAMYLDPGVPSSRDLIVRGVIELIENYNIDGIHFDDYFYPGRDFDDAATFARYGYGWDDIDEWRRENVNIMVREVQQAIRSTRPEVRFGISPFAIWRNIGTDPLGSDTRGMESFSQLYSDSRRWVLEGWVDYITPQIYWHIGNEAACFSIVLHWWRNLVAGTGVDLYVGMAPYREVQERANWDGQTLRQLEYMQYFDGIDGHVMFRIDFLMGRVGDVVQDFYGTQEYFDRIFMPAATPEPASVPASGFEGTAWDTGLTIVQPGRDVTVTNAQGYFMFGASDPGLPLFLNGSQVENRTAEGFWSAFVPLELGDEVFTLTQDGRPPVTRTITNRAPVAATSAPPAPPVQINEVPPTHPLYATVGDAVTWGFPGHTTTGGSHLVLLPGQRDRVAAITSDGGWLRLSSGVWVQSENVTTVTESRRQLNPLGSGTYRIDWPDLHTIAWRAEGFPVLNMSYNYGALTVYFGMHTIVPAVDVVRSGNLEDTIFSGIYSGNSDGTPFYRFYIRDDVNFEGFWVSQRYDEVRLHLKLRKPLHYTVPLHGFVFVIDPGHGGNDPGALGALGAEMPEREIVLRISHKLREQLESLGAQVHMTRADNTGLTLLQRTEFSRSVKPDMFISIHTDSVAETTDSTNIRGATVLFRNQLSAPAADVFVRHLHTVNPYSTRHFGARQQNLFVCRPSWAPSVLIEASFTNNVHDFSWLINPVNQENVAAAIVAAVLEYYGE